MADLNKVIIVGAGLGGLSCAIACKMRGLDTVILERAPEILPVGAGIQIPSNAARVLHRYKLLEKIKTKATVLETLDLRRYEDGKLLCTKSLGDKLIEQVGMPWMVIHREDYQAILLEEATRLGVVIKLGASVKEASVEKDEVVLEDGNIISGSVIIGADGLWSSIRTNVLGCASPPTETGDLAYRGTFSKAQLLALQDPRVEALCAKRTVTVWMGPNKHTVFYPVKSGTQFNMVLLRPDNLPTNTRVVKGDIEEMRDTFKGWDPVLTKIISCIPSVLKWKLCHHEELKAWTKNHTVLLGDACHPTLPYQAQGAAMAVEDGAVLGFLLGALKTCLTSPGTASLTSPDPLQSVLKLYESLRKSRTTLNVQGAQLNRIFFHLSDGPEQKGRDEDLGKIDWDGGTTRWKWADNGYQKDLLGFDAVGDAEEKFEAWWRDQTQMKQLQGKGKGKGDMQVEQVDTGIKHSMSLLRWSLAL